jgi:hypothetical protein
MTYLITTPTGQTLWTGKVDVVPGGVWLLTPSGSRVWSVPADAVRQLTRDEALAYVAAKGKR